MWQSSRHGDSPKDWHSSFRENFVDWGAGILFLD